MAWYRKVATRKFRLNQPELRFSLHYIDVFRFRRGLRKYHIEQLGGTYLVDCNTTITLDPIRTGVVRELFDVDQTIRPRRRRPPR